MGDTTRWRLRKFEGQTTLPVQGWGAVAIGLLFASTGSLPLLIGIGMMAFGTRPRNPLGWVIAVFGSVFIIFGLAALVVGVRGPAGTGVPGGPTALARRDPGTGNHPWHRGGARRRVEVGAVALRLGRIPRPLPLAVLTCF